MRKILTKEEWFRRRRRKRRIVITMMSLLLIVILFLSGLLIRMIWKNMNWSGMEGRYKGIEAIDPALTNGVQIQQDYLTPNEYSRPQTPLLKINGVVLHYTANPGTSAANNRSYFEGLSVSKSTYASSHYIIGIEGEVLQCIPLTEISYASNERNDDTIAIECCIPDETGKFSDATYSSAVALTAALCIQFELGEEDIIRHYDITGKNCPKYFVEHEDAWITFKADVTEKMEEITNAQAKVKE